MIRNTLLRKLTSFESNYVEYFIGGHPLVSSFNNQNIVGIWQFEHDKNLDLDKITDKHIMGYILNDNFNAELS